MKIDEITYSVIVPSYFEQDNLEKLIEELVPILESKNATFEIILVDDGSTDKTWEKIQALNKKDGRVKGLQFSKNFGHQYALLAGFNFAKGKAIITMDADLQHPPKFVNNLINEWEKGFKIVNTIRIDSAKISWIKKLTSKLFYKIFSFLSGVDINPGMADFRLLDRQVVNELLEFGESGLFLRGLIGWLGYPHVNIEYKAAERFAGTTKYTFGKMIKFALDGISSFSLVPLRLGIILGILTSLFAFIELIYVVSVRIFTEVAIPGWASGLGVVSFLFGVLFIIIGVLGEYIGYILVETKRRPRFIINEKIGI
ncbi:MAG: glycosyltransferase family 2 protein [Melioribacteraceae bacterium]